MRVGHVSDFRRILLPAWEVDEAGYPPPASSIPRFYSLLSGRVDLVMLALHLGSVLVLTLMLRVLILLFHD